MRRTGLGYFTSALAGLVVGALLVAALPAIGSAGDDMIVGEKNTSAGKVTRLKGKGNPTLRLINWNSRPALELRVSAGAAPMKVNSAGLVVNLNSDMVDGIEAAGFSPAGHVHSFYIVEETGAESLSFPAGYGRLEADCDSGDIVVGGGWRDRNNFIPSFVENGGQFNGSFPLDSDTWAIEFRYTAGGTAYPTNFDWYAVCYDATA
jgi:hypothetical protein